MPSFLNPFNLFGGGGNTDGGIANDNQTTNASQDDHSNTLGNGAVLNSGTLNLTDGGATQAALDANVKVMSSAFGLVNAALSGAASGTGGGASGTPFTASAAPATAQPVLNKNNGIILAAVAVILAVIFFFRKGKK